MRPRVVAIRTPEGVEGYYCVVRRGVRTWGEIKELLWALEPLWRELDKVAFGPRGRRYEMWFWRFWFALPKEYAEPRAVFELAKEFSVSVVEGSLVDGEYVTDICGIGDDMWVCEHCVNKLAEVVREPKGVMLSLGKENEGGPVFLFAYDGKRMRAEVHSVRKKLVRRAAELLCR